MQRVASALIVDLDVSDTVLDISDTVLVVVRAKLSRLLPPLTRRCQVGIDQKSRSMVDSAF